LTNKRKYEIIELEIQRQTKKIAPHDPQRTWGAITTEQARGTWAKGFRKDMITQTTKKVKQIAEALLMIYLHFRADYGEALNGRLARAYRIASDGLVTQITPNSWQVTAGTNGRAPYTVTFDMVWQCTCPDCSHEGYAPTIEFCGSVQPVCKHIAAVALLWTSGLNIPQAEAKPAAQPASNGRSAFCPTCYLSWQQCNCQKNGLPQPAKVTVLSPEAKRKFEEMIEHSRARNAQGQKALDAALKPEGRRRRTSCEFTNVQRWP
jgi:hypothetical protein